MTAEVRRRGKKANPREESGEAAPPTLDGKRDDIVRKEEPVAEFDARRWKLLKFSLRWRFLVITFQAVSNFLVPDWRHHPDEAFQTPKNVEHYTTVDHVVEFCFGGLARWDAEYFVHIARFGYDREQAIAFFPLWPYLLSASSRLFLLPGAFLGRRSAILVSGVLLNLVFSVAAADALMRLTAAVFASSRGSKFASSSVPVKTARTSYYAAVLFVVCPATVYFSALYTEPIFAWATFEGLYQLYGRRSVLTSSCLFFVGSLTRANGILNAGFLLHHGLTMFRRELRVAPLLLAVAGTLIAASPFLLVQAWHVATFCSETSPLLHLPVWCAGRESPYARVQAQYWGVGFLAAWRARKIPEFVVVLPVFGLCIVRYLGSWFGERGSDVVSLGGLWLSEEKEDREKKPSSAAVDVIPVGDPGVVAFWFHATFLMVFGLIYVYVLTLLRFWCSSTPVVFWAAVATLQDLPSFARPESLKSKPKVAKFCFEPETPMDLLRNVQCLYRTKEMDSLAIHVFYLFWGLFGVVLFSNFITAP